MFHTGPAADNRLPQRTSRCDGNQRRCKVANRIGTESPTGKDRPQSHEAKNGAIEPAVPKTDLAVSGRHPREQKTSSGPLQ
jgi:hypothetical protein